MIRAEAFVFNNFMVNTYLVWDDSGQCLVVDPAFYYPGEQLYFEDSLRERGLTLTGQVNTHCHVDHVLGIRHVKTEHGCPFRAHREEERIAATVTLMGNLFGLHVESLEGIDEFIRDGQPIPVGNHELISIHVPGHSPGSLAFYSLEGGFVITGDALFRESIGRTDLPGGDYDVLLDSIRNRLLVLPPETVVFPGHGPSSTIGNEISGNPFLRPV
jgi:hydroxyacylglutathione hydrolase